jgi:hypothetical protein
MDLPSVHIPTAISQDVKAICVSREALIKTRTQPNSTDPSRGDVPCAVEIQRRFS